MEKQVRKTEETERAICAVICHSDGINAKDIAQRLSLDRKTVNHILYSSPLLKQANDKLGQEAGDAMILDVSACIIEVFGAGNAYRTGGDEFVAYSVQSNHAAFDRNIDRLRTLITERGRSAAIGAVFRENGGADYEKAKTEADAMMYEDKRNYYEANPGKSR